MSLLSLWQQDAALPSAITYLYSEQWGKEPKLFPCKHLSIHSGRKAPLSYVLFHHIGHKYVKLTPLDGKKFGLIALTVLEVRTGSIANSFWITNSLQLPNPRPLQMYFLLVIQFWIKCHLFRKAFCAAHFRRVTLYILYLAMSLRDLPLWNLNWIPCSLTFGQWETWENETQAILGCLSSVSLPARPPVVSLSVSFSSFLPLLSYCCFLSGILWLFFVYVPSDLGVVMTPWFLAPKHLLSSVSFSYPCPHLSLLWSLH